MSPIQPGASAGHADPSARARQAPPELQPHRGFVTHGASCAQVRDDRVLAQGYRIRAALPQLFERPFTRGSRSETNRDDRRHQSRGARPQP